MKSNYDKIKIEFETSPEIAFLFAISVHQGLNSESEIINSLSEEAKKEVHQLAQTIIDQVCQKTNFKYKFGEN